MDVKPGYKQTEVGVIPEDWKAGVLGDFVALQRGHDLTDRMRCPGNIPVMGSAGQNGFHDTALAKGPGVIVGRSGASFGQVHYCKDDYWPHNTALYVTNFLGNDPLFTFYYISHINFTSHNSGGAQQSLNRNFIYPIKVATPHYYEQRVIATALSDADALIESLEQLIAKKRSIKQGAMQELLTGKRRLPGFSGEWEVKRLGELFEITSSKRVFQRDWKSDGVPFYRARELAILGEAGHVENDLFITKSLYESFRSVHGVPSVGDMLVTGVGTLGKVFTVTDDKEFYFKDGNIIWFKIGGKVSVEFLRQLYLTTIVMKQITDASAGTTVGTYTISGAKKTEIPLPSIPEQEAIATVLSDMDAELSTLESKLSKARQIKQGMMQELLTGRIRLV
ncbi:restriction endonuclease subunit S [Fundidesulfovibrio soli]|uniref:restriction endonuclease subunit S n=1 Tax=Fundidesulfovibrio soli TaxID=2922716 RepID=UPI001FAEEE5D|nr:restriction endonuclease subunit S [Fundidesulfovibrio soli]